MSSPPGPENGAAQSLHRGELGRLARNRRFLWNGAWSTSMLRHFSSDAVGRSEDGSVLGSPADPGISAILRRARQRAPVLGGIHQPRAVGLRLHLLGGSSVPRMKRTMTAPTKATAT